MEVSKSWLKVSMVSIPFYHDFKEDKIASKIRIDQTTRRMCLHQKLSSPYASRPDLEGQDHPKWRSHRSPRRRTFRWPGASRRGRLRGEAVTFGERGDAATAACEGRGWWWTGTSSGWNPKKPVEGDQRRGPHPRRGRKWRRHRSAGMGGEGRTRGSRRRRGG